MQSIDWVSILFNFLATFAGVSIAFALAFAYDRWKKECDEREAESDLLRTLQNEMKQNQHSVEEIDPQNEEILMQQNFFDYAWLTGVNSGQLTLLKPQLQSEIASLYRELEAAKRTNDELSDLIGSTSNVYQLKVLRYSNRWYSFLELRLTSKINALRTQIPNTTNIIEARIAELERNNRGFLMWLYLSMARYFVFV